MDTVTSRWGCGGCSPVFLGSGCLADLCLPQGHHVPTRPHLCVCCSALGRACAASDFLLLWPPAWPLLLAQDVTVLFIESLNLDVVRQLRAASPCRPGPDLAAGGTSRPFLVAYGHPRRPPGASLSAAALASRSQEVDTSAETVLLVAPGGGGPGRVLPAGIHLL